MGKRIDVVLLIGAALFVLEFKLGEKDFLSSAIDQVWDYALDLKNFHESSDALLIAPVLIATKAKSVLPVIATTNHHDKLLLPIKCNVETLSQVMVNVLLLTNDERIDRVQWENGRYCPTPTIIEAAKALYSGHSVSEISR